MSPDCPAVLGDDQLPVEELAVLSPRQSHLALHHVRLSQHQAGLRGVARPELEENLRPLIEFPINPDSRAGGVSGEVLQVSAGGDDDQPGGWLGIDRPFTQNISHKLLLVNTPQSSPTEQETFTEF